MRRWVSAAGLLLGLTLSGSPAALAQLTPLPGTPGQPARPHPPAQPARPGPSLQGGEPERPTRSPILFSADELQTDEALGLIVARGHVQISQDLRTLLADVVTYNRRTDTITASGHVSLQEPTGEVLFADYMELRNHFQEGFMRDLRILLSDRSRIAANTGRRLGGEITDLRRGVYSPCDLCAKDPSKPPIWQIKAEQMSHDQETHVIKYHDAVLEFGGIPVFYTPYFSHPDPTVRRQSGFLAPTIGNSSSLGGHATIPYFWDIGPDRDITFSPIFTTLQGAVADADYRQRFSNGELDFDASVNNGTSPNPPNNSAIRGHVAAFGRWDLSDEWRTGFDLQRASDQTYEQLFHFSGTQNFLTSRAFAEDFGGRSYLNISAYTFQTLRQNTSDSDQPQIAPVIDYNWIGQPDDWGGRTSINANLLDLNRLRGTGSHRLSVGTAWTRPFKGLVGDQLTFTASTRADAYNATDLQITPNNAPENADTGRIYPQLALKWQYPWVRRGGSTSQLIEPIVSFIAGPNGENPATIPNEDSLSFDFNDTDLFRPDRFAGLDRVDPGDRVDYGLHAAVYGDGGGSSSMLIGQSYRLQNTDIFPVGSGLEDKESDIVGRFVVTPSTYFSTIYRYRLQHQDLRLVRQELTAAGGPRELRLSASYIKLPPDLESNDTGKRDQVSAAATVGLSRYWTISGQTTQNLTGSLGTVSSGVIATYQDECFAFIASLTQSGTSNRDIKPGVSLLFTIVLKNFGQLNAPALATGGQ